MAKRNNLSVKPSTPIASVRHRDTRKNIPTEALRGFVAAGRELEMGWDAGDHYGRRRPRAIAAPCPPPAPSSRRPTAVRTPP